MLREFLESKTVTTTVTNTHDRWSLLVNEEPWKQALVAAYERPDTSF
jgi:hypothetical protein